MSKPIPIAPHTVEPYDGNDRMVTCAKCLGSAGSNGNYRCPRYVPSMATVPQHCNRYRSKP